MSEPPPTSAPPDAHKPPAPKAFPYRRTLLLVLGLLTLYGLYVLNRFSSINAFHQQELANAATELRIHVDNHIEMGVSNGWDPKSFKIQIDKAGITLAALRVKDPPSSTKANQDLKQPTLGGFFEQLAYPDSFRLIFAAKADGTVIYQGSSADGQWRRQLRWGEREFRDSAADEGADLQIENIAPLTGGKDAWTKLSSSSGQTTLNAGGQWYQLHLQPVVLTKSGDPLVLGGLVLTRDAIHEALSVGTYFEAALLFLLLVGILGFPVVKLLVLDRHERFRLKDVYLLYGSSAALLLLLTFLVLCGDSYYRWSVTANNGLKSLADKLAGQFRSEVDGIVKAVDQADEQVDWWDCARLYMTEPGWFASKSPSLALPGKLYFKALFWADANGWQVWKITSDKTGANIDVGGRSYFKAVRDGNMYQTSDTGKRFFIMPDRSIIDGQFRTFVAMSSRGYCAMASDKDGQVAVATANLYSLDRIPLPDGYGFAVVNREGRVLYHSDSRLALREDFFADLDEGPKLRSLTFAEREYGFSATYRGRPHALYVKPLDLQRSPIPDGKAGWSVVTFRDVSPVLSAVSDVLVTSLAGPLLLLIIAMAATMWSISRVTVHRGTWLWPHRGLEEFYRRMTLSLTSVLLAALVLYAAGLGAAVFLGVPVGAAICAVALHYRRSREGEPVREPGLSWWHNAQLALLAICVVIVPGAAIFRLTMGHELGNLIHTENVWMDQQVQDARLAMDADERSLGHNPAVAQDAAVRAHKLVKDYRVAPFDAKLTEIGPGSLWLVKAHELIDRLLPLANEATRQSYQHVKYAYTPDGILRDRFAISWIGVLGLASIGALLMIWIRYYADSVFLAGLAPAATPVLTLSELQDRWHEAHNDAKNVLVHVARDHIANPRQRDCVQQLLEAGLLRFTPALEPASPEFRQFIAAQVPRQETQSVLRSWEKEAEQGRFSWRHTRLVLGGSLALLAVFVVATQPGVQSDIVGIAGGVAGVLTTGLTSIRELHKAVLEWTKK